MLSKLRALNELLSELKSFSKSASVIVLSLFTVILFGYYVIPWLI